MQALFHNKYVESGLSLPFLKSLLGRPLKLSDLEQIDPAYYNTLTWILYVIAIFFPSC